MAKIRAEIIVATDNCKFCPMFDEEYRVCDLFNRFIPYDAETNTFKRCEECKKAEVKDEEVEDDT